MRQASYVIVEDDFLGESPLVVKDVGPWDKHPSVTNDAEGVVLRLISDGHLRNHRRLFYIDSDGRKDEILVRNGAFAGFKPGPR